MSAVTVGAQLVPVVWGSRVARRPYIERVVGQRPGATVIHAPRPRARGCGHRNPVRGLCTERKRERLGCWRTLTQAHSAPQVIWATLEAAAIVSRSSRR